ncbi:uncharacterized protein LOC109793393 [Cajanus cajan]|uniref:uncharacterized protein LOC109793393 n=1 Tax=Cajanus cajan TaxID=3821 RepID=UPI00098D8695|nr:uncharacterized protein LOC109793393 [Cajanus cajan]
MNTCTFIMNSVQVPSPMLITSFKTVPSFKCCSRSSDEKERDDVKDTVSGMVDEQVQELLSRKENKVLLDGLEKASQRVEMAKRELALIEKQEFAVKQLKDYVNQLESKVLEYSVTGITSITVKMKVEPLASLPKLQFLSLLDNNNTKKANYRLYVINKLKSLWVLDFKKVKNKTPLSLLA